MDWNFMLITELFSGSDKAHLLTEGLTGLEKEAQRVTVEGDLALTPHPAVFGDKLENPCITTDFAESQIEMITPPLKLAEEVLEYLERLQSEVEAGIGDEKLWPLSMPPRLPEEERIALARFNDTDRGRENEIYRNGLAMRYGRKMQMISGIHYNFSLGEGLADFLYDRFGKGGDKRSFMDETYFLLIRNYLRYRWLLIYLFGASPAADVSYTPIIRQELMMVSKCCPECCSTADSCNEYATSLRVSRFGYSNANRGENEVYFDSLAEYAGKLRKLLGTRSRRFVKLGIRKNERRLQLNDCVLQKESEFYSSIRPKQLAAKGGTILDALEKEGVGYLEVRIFDLNPFEKAGVSLDQLLFLQVFMLFCLFGEDRLIGKREMNKINKNHHLTALTGRKPELKLFQYDGDTQELRKWGSEIFDGLEQLATLMDQGRPGAGYLRSVQRERRKLNDTTLLPSSRIFKEMADNKESFLETGLRLATGIKKQNLYTGVV